MTCTSCGQPIADSSRFCPGCGAAIGGPPPLPVARRTAVASPQEPDRVQTIEQTSKQWKVVMLIGITAMFGGCGACTSGTFIFEGRLSEELISLGMLSVFVGFSTFVVGKATAWWNHG